MTTLIFEFTSCFINNHGDWEGDEYYLIATDIGLTLISVDDWKLDEENIKKEFPNGTFYGVLFTTNRHLSCSQITDKLKEEYPDIYEKLDKWLGFEDLRLK